jgi:serine/threonine protein kinase
MYLEPNNFISGVETWIHIVDSDSPLKFGDRGENPEFTNSPRWLTKFGGQLMVLSSPYILGEHYATSVQQLLEAVNELDKLHSAGYVHGDIRAYNIIFKNDGICFIDFDIGGQVGIDSTKYTAGYTQYLRDGTRVGKPGEAILKRHDWRALMLILFEKHRVNPPLPKSQEPDPVERVPTPPVDELSMFMNGFGRFARESSKLSK